MFDPSEYLIELNESSNKAAFTKIGRVIARDPDLSRNSLVRYYVNCNQNGDSSSSAEDKQSYSSQINNKASNSINEPSLVFLPSQTLKKAIYNKTNSIRVFPKFYNLRSASSAARKVGFDIS